MDTAVEKIMVRSAVAVVVVLGLLVICAVPEAERNARITAVDASNYDEEVQQVQDQKPVLIYYYRQNENLRVSDVDRHQLNVVKEFAWFRNSDVKIVAVNVEKQDNLALATGAGVDHTPAFVFVYRDNSIAGKHGFPADYVELTRLYSLLPDRR